MDQVCWPSSDLRCGDIALEVSYLEASWVSLCPSIPILWLSFSSNPVTGMGPSKNYDCSVSQALVKAFSAIITGFHAGNTQTVAGIGPWNVDSAIHT